MPVRISLWVPKLDTRMGHPSGRPQDSSRAAAVMLCKCHGDVPGSTPIISAPILEPVCVLLSDFGIGSPWGDSLS